MDGMGLGLLGVKAAKVEAESSRPWAPVRPDRRHRRGRESGVTHPPRVVRPRRALATVLHRLADAVAPNEAGHLVR